MVAIVIQVAEDAQAGLLVGKNEAAEIAVEGLDSGARGDEIVVAAEIGQLDFDERFLQSNVAVEPRVSFAHVDVDDAVFLHVEVVDVDLGRDLDAPVDRPERCVAVKQIKRKRQVLAHKKLPKASEELLAAGVLGTEAARNRDAPAIRESIADERKIEKGLISDDGVVALELVLIERIVPVTFHVRILALFVVAPIIREIVGPTIRNHVEDLVVAGKRFQRAEVPQWQQAAVPAAMSCKVNWERLRAEVRQVWVRARDRGEFHGRPQSQWGSLSA